MTRKGKGVRMKGDEAEEEEKKKEDLSAARTWRFLNREDTSAKATEEERQKEQVIEESARLNDERAKALMHINEVLADLLDSEQWWEWIRKFLEDACSDETTTAVTMVLKRVKDDRWILDATVS